MNKIKKSLEAPVYTITKEQQFNCTKERFNAFQCKTGVVEGAKDKLKRRNSKENRKLKNNLKAYCY